jgi:peptide deformylase
VIEIVVPEEFKPLWQESEKRPVVKYPADVLRQVAEPAERVNKSIRSLIDKMERAMDLAHGVGLAAPQMGQSIRVILVDDDGERVALVNPRVVHEEGEVIGQEGCLSLPGLYGDVKRKAIVEVRGLDKEGRQIKRRFEGLASRVAQHEIDHLDGVLFIDKVDMSTLHWEWPPGVERD